MKNSDPNQEKEIQNQVQSKNSNIEFIYESQNLNNQNNIIKTKENFHQSENNNLKIHQATNLNIEVVLLEIRSRI